MTEQETFRRQKDGYFRTGPDSPIPHEQRVGLRLIVQPEEFAEKDSIQMTTPAPAVCRSINAGAALASRLISSRRR
jgi:hypothetical protein